MIYIQTIASIFWLVWVVFFYRLVWTKTGDAHPNLVLAVLPILLPFNKFWHAGTEGYRFTLVVSALLMAAFTIGSVELLKGSGVLHAS
jgi:hypothetical protein